MTTYHKSHRLWKLSTVASLIGRNLLNASRSPVVAHVVRLAPPGIVPKREELAFGIRIALSLTTGKP